MGDRDPGALEINTRHTPGLVCLLSPKSCQWRTLEPYTPNPGRGALKNTLFSKPKFAQEGRRPEHESTIPFCPVTRVSPRYPEDKTRSPFQPLIVQKSLFVPPW